LETSAGQLHGNRRRAVAHNHWHVDQERFLESDVPKHVEVAEHSHALSVNVERTSGSLVMPALYDEQLDLVLAVLTDWKCESQWCADTLHVENSIVLRRFRCKRKVIHDGPVVSWSDRVPTSTKRRVAAPHITVAVCHCCATSVDPVENVEPANKNVPCSPNSSLQKHNTIDSGWLRRTCGFGQLHTDGRRAVRHHHGHSQKVWGPEPAIHKRVDVAQHSCTLHVHVERTRCCRLVPAFHNQQLDFVQTVAADRKRVAQLRSAITLVEQNVRVRRRDVGEIVRQSRNIR
jgi:hypothetical protein